MKKRITALLCAAVLSLILTACAPVAFAASEAATAGEDIKPVSVEEYTWGGFDVLRVKKVYQLAVSEAPRRIPTDDFIRGGYKYSLIDLTMKNEIGVDTKEYTKTVTMDTKTSDTAEAIRLLDAQKEVQTEDGYTGTLILDHTSVKVSVKGYKTNTKNITASRTYQGLVDADLDLIPKTITENGNSLTLSDAQWTSSTDEDGNLRFTASATYTGTSTSRYATGYVLTANYVGNVVKTNCELITYTAVFEGERLPREYRPASVTNEKKPEADEADAVTAADGESADTAAESADGQSDGAASDANVPGPDGVPGQTLYLDREHWMSVTIVVFCVVTLGGAAVYYSAKREKEKGDQTET
ncbi:MAG: hypothetical protein IJT94_08415 [Oscillibacter sp.]|nr:hypothetical protein [Oscillibacter sp.]